ncbi:myosin regulatory light chain 2, skeletal muscle isoform type 2, partial [Clarias magur]
MKIHGKILHHYLSSGAPDKEGYLYKKGEVNTSYQKRWFSLKGNLLFYRERRSERDILGVIVLERCVVQLCDSEEHFAFSVSFFGDAEEADGLRTYKFSAEDQASQESWVKALHSANHGYLELLVRDLRQQYLEAARNAGVDPVDMSAKEMMRHFQKPHKCPGSNSVFYTPNENQVLQAPPTNSKQATRRSPKLWPKRHIVGPAPCSTEWAAEPLPDFCQLHEYFGQEAPKKAKRRQQGEGGSSNVFSMFEQSQIQEYKEAFTIIDQNRDGIISKDDLRDVLASMGQLNVKNEELEAMIKEASGPINFTVFLTMFGEKLKGADPEDVIVSAFKVLDPEATGTIKKEFLEELLTTQCDRFSAEEMKNLWGAFPPDVAGNVDYKNICYVITHGEEKE